MKQIQTKPTTCTHWRIELPDRPMAPHRCQDCGKPFLSLTEWRKERGG